MNIVPDGHFPGLTATTNHIRRRTKRVRFPLSDAFDQPDCENDGTDVLVCGASTMGSVRVRYGIGELRDGVKTVTVHTRMDGGEHEGTFFLGGDADTASKLVPVSVEELARDFEPINIDPARAVDLATVVAPVDDEGLG